MYSYKIKKEIFHYLIILTAFFLLLELSFFFTCNQTYLSTFNFVSSNIHLPLAIVPSILFFIFAQLFVHIMYCMLICWISVSMASLFKLTPQRTIAFSIGCWFQGLLTILLANQNYFPHSKFADLTSTIFFDPSLTKFLLTLLIAIAAIELTLAVLMRWQSSIILAVIAVFYFFPVKFPENNLVATTARPNIIVVGIDSLRPDFLGFFGADQATPFLDNMLEQSTVFSEAVTPLARTFPSWIGIITGKYPSQSGVRFNLANQDNINFSQSLPNILRQNGYETIYATDETRFSNIDKNAGFDRIIAPPSGLNDFLLGTFNDFPLSNLLINTALGRWLFPYSYANRPVYFTYQPDSFLNLLTPTLQATRTKPLFFAVHFCLPHHPYLWADSTAETFPVTTYYAQSIQRADKQIRDFFALLKQSHLLDHAIVVILSDHGEALALSGDRLTEQDAYIPRNKKPPKFYPDMPDTDEMNQTAGHGTEVLGLTQYHSLLAFRFYE